MSSIYTITLPKNRNGESGVLHVDLSKILLVSNAVFINRMGNGGYFAESQIIFENRADPIVLSVEQPYTMLEDKRPTPDVNADNVPTKVAELQSVIDEMRNAWSGYTNHRDRSL